MDLHWYERFFEGVTLDLWRKAASPEQTRVEADFLQRELKVRPGARFALDYGLAAECILPRLKEREWCQIEDILFLEENRYLVNESCVETTYTFVRDGKTDVRIGLQWVFTVREILAILAEAGL